MSTTLHIDILFTEDLTDPGSRVHTIGHMILCDDTIQSCVMSNPIVDDEVLNVFVKNFPAYVEGLVADEWATSEFSSIVEFLNSKMQRSNFYIKPTHFEPETRDAVSVPDIILTGKDEAGKILMTPDRVAIKHILSIGEVESSYPAGYARISAMKMRLEFDDVNFASNPIGYVGCTEDDVRRIVLFSSRVRKYPGTVLVHCAAGISRSAAAVLVMLADFYGPGREDEAFEHLFRVQEWSTKNKYRSGGRIYPNQRIVKLADDFLIRHGLLYEALHKYFNYSYRI